MKSDIKPSSRVWVYDDKLMIQAGPFTIEWTQNDFPSIMEFFNPRSISGMHKKEVNV